MGKTMRSILEMETTLTPGLVEVVEDENEWHFNNQFGQTLFRLPAGRIPEDLVVAIAEELEKAIQRGIKIGMFQKALEIRRILEAPWSGG